jgi:hypothetical protein
VVFEFCCTVVASELIGIASSNFANQKRLKSRFENANTCLRLVNCKIKTHLDLTLILRDTSNEVKWLETLFSKRVLFLAQCVIDILFRAQFRVVADTIVLDRSLGLEYRSMKMTYLLHIGKVGMRNGDIP